jgi:exosome complex component RRP40
MVIGIVLEKHMEGFKLDIGSAHSATLNWDGFEPSSRKNRPQWPPGSVVYGRVSLANKDMEPEIVCTAPSGKAEGYGLLEGGVVIKCSLAHARSLLSPNCAVLKFLGKKIPYEIAVGLNGRVWINSATSRNTILIANTIKRSENLPAQQVEQLVQQMIEASRER